MDNHFTIYHFYQLYIFLYLLGTGGPGPGQYDPFKEPGIRAPIDLVI